MKPSPGACLVAAVLTVIAATPAGAAISRYSIELSDALGIGFGSAPQRTVRLELFLDGKDVGAVLVLPTARNPALAGWDARDIASTLAWKGGELSGIVTAAIVPVGGGDPAPWKCVVSAAWRDGALTGRANSFMGNTSMAANEFSAKPEKLDGVRKGDGFVELVLPGTGATAGAHAGIEFRDGKAVAAASFGPFIHPVWQQLDASGLALKRGRLSGRLAWIAGEAGEDGVAFAPGEVEIKANLRDGFATMDRDGAAGVAVISPAPAFPEHASIELAFDAPLVGGEQWRRRVVVRIEKSRGKTSATAFFNGRADPDWSAVVDGVALETKGGYIAGTVDATVASATVQPGFYRIQFKGEIIGPWIAGTFNSALAGTDAAKGGFTGWFEPIGRH